MSNSQYNHEEDEAIMFALATQYRHFGFLIPLDDDDEDETNANYAS